MVHEHRHHRHHYTAGVVSVTGRGGHIRSEVVENSGRNSRSAARPKGERSREEGRQQRRRRRRQRQAIDCRPFYHRVVTAAPDFRARPARRVFIGRRDRRRDTSAAALYASRGTTLGRHSLPRDTGQPRRVSHLKRKSLPSNPGGASLFHFLLYVSHFSSAWARLVCAKNTYIGR